MVSPTLTSATSQIGEPLVSEEEFANTYSPTGLPNGWASVQAFREWQEWQSHNPEAGRTAAAAALEQPENRIRVWKDGGRPDAVRGFEVAKERGWIDVDPESQLGEGLVRLVAWIQSSGAILGEGMMPRFTLSDVDSYVRFGQISNVVGFEYRLDHTEDDDRATEAVPVDGGSVLGRVLGALGASVGEDKVERERLPRVVRLVGESGRRAFVETYLRNRGRVNPEWEQWLVVQEEQTDRYHDELADLIEEAVGEVVLDENGLRVELDALESTLGMKRNEFSN